VTQRGETRLDHESFETAAEHATLAVPIVSPGARAREIVAAVAGRTWQCASHVVVCEDERFRGVIRIEDVFSAAPDARAGELMDSEAPVVAPGVDQEHAAWRAVRHGEAALAVVDAGGRFRGLIPPDRLVAVLLSEHEEDLARLGGFLKGATIARHSSEEPVVRRFWHRLPWLLVGLAGAFAAADLVGWFESRLREQIAIAFFIPGIVYLADAVGTQTETVMVRAISLGIAARRLVGREALTGLAIGSALALLAFPLLYWRWSDPNLALRVALALGAACSTASVVAMALPWLLDRLDVDPAFGSGPVATVIQDLLSIAIYFAIVTA
jgi:magnesium transporter